MALVSGIKKNAKWARLGKAVIASNATTLFTKGNVALRIVDAALELNAQLLFVMKYLGSRPPKTLKTSEQEIRSLLLVVKLLL
jgi:hypothetical protein